MSTDLQAPIDAFDGGVVPESPSERFAVGVMTGTSLDGIDAALIRGNNRGLDLEVETVTHAHTPMGASAHTLRLLAAGQRVRAEAIAEAGNLLAEQIVEAIRELGDLPELTCIAVHGQTVHHGPSSTWQLINLAPIVAAFQVPAVTGQRLGDMSRGGSGAPLTPLTDWIACRHLAPCVIVNLGGFANATALGSNRHVDSVAGRDLTPCNHLLNTLASTRLGVPFDKDGAAAMSGTPDAPLARLLLGTLVSRTAGKTAMGQADIHDDVLDSLQGIPPEHAAATLAMVLGTIIGIEASKLGDGPLLLAGGSMHHVALVQTIKEASPRPVEMYPNAPAREAAAMATLGLLELDGVAPSLVQVTGRSPGPMPGSLWMRPML